MNNYQLLDLVTDLGYRLAMSGAETFRIEESISRISAAYGAEGEAFAIPNCLTVTVRTQDGASYSRVRRIGNHGNDLDAVEKYSNLSRRICASPPEIGQAALWLQEVDASRISYRIPILLLGNFMGSFGFALFFGAGLVDCLCAGICGLVVGLVVLCSDALKANPFFRTIFAAFALSFTAYAMATNFIAVSADTIIIGALMLLVPGLLFTNAMRDIIGGDINSGTNRVMQVILIAAAIVLGTATAWNSAAALFGTPVSITPVAPPFWLQEIGCLIGCIGFAILFNIHGPGVLLCALGGLLSWAAYTIAIKVGNPELSAYFWASLFASIYSEIMARIRKYPAISYLVVSIFPLIPGASIYYTTNFAVRGELSSFAEKALDTIAIAGFMAVGIFAATASIRIWNLLQQNRSKQ